MAFSDKKGINVASPFKLQAEELLDVRQKVDTIAERDELITIHAAAPGLRVFVKANKTTYVYNGSGWDALISSANIGNQSVTTAAKLSSSAGSATQPIYFSGGKPVACSYTLGKSVPSNAVFTDTTYSDMKGATSTGAGTHGLVPAPSAGTANRYLRSDGTWAVPPDTNTTYTLSSFGISATADEINNLKGIKGNVQEYIDRIFTKADNIDAKKLNLTGGKLTGDIGIPKEQCTIMDGGVPYAGSSGYLDKWEDITKYKTYLGSLAVGGSDLSNWNHLISIRHYNGYKRSTSSGFYMYTSYSTDNGLTFRKQKDTNTWYDERVLLDSVNYSSYVAAATHSHSTATASAAGFMPKLDGSTSKYLRGDGTWATPPNDNTTYSLSSFGITASATEINYTKGVTSSIQTQLNGKAASSHSHSTATASAAGFMPKLNGSTSNYLRGDGTWATPPNTNTTYSNMKGATTSAAGGAGLVPAPAAGAATRYLRSDGTWAVPPDTNTTYSDATTSSHGLMTADMVAKLNGIAAGANAYSHPTSSGNKHIPAGGSSGQILRWSADGTAVWGSDNNTTYSAFKGATASAAGGTGLVPAPSAGAATRYLRSDGTWQVPPDTNTNTWIALKGATTSAAGTAGYAPAPAAGAANRYLRCDGTWQVPPDNNTTYSLASFGISASATEINYTKGVTSPIQTQLNGKASTGHTHNYAGSDSAGGSAYSATVSYHPAITNSNEIRFVKPSWSTKQTLWFGYAWSDGTSSDLIEQYNFANGAGGVANVAAKTFIGNLSGNATSASSASKASGVIDYNDSNRTIQVGFSGDGLTSSTISYFACYDSSGKIKDASVSEVSAKLGLSNYASASHSHSTASTSAAGFMPKLNGSTSNYLRGDGSWATPPNTNTDTKVTNTASNTSTAYITGTTSSSTNTGTQVFDTGVYLTSTSGRMHTGSLEIGGAILTYDSTNKALTISFS